MDEVFNKYLQFYASRQKRQSMEASMEASMEFMTVATAPEIGSIDDIINRYNQKVNSLENC